MTTGNAGILFARYLDKHKELCRGKNVLELGAGASLPSMIAALNGAKMVVTTDYPEALLIDQLAVNVKQNVSLPNIHATVLD